MKTLDSNLFFFSSDKQADHQHPLVLAYIGDVVHEMYVRQYVVSNHNAKVKALHTETTKHVSARGQVEALKKWMPHLTEKETEVVKRGRNSKSGQAPKSASVMDYRHSTGFECLVGYLYLTEQWDRLQELFNMTITEDDKK
ncbi:Mini-ribonuclease 3 [Longirhabdus pacifica]|uniref:Mini-ribonuclease 3 n=1 Tax=Longirhabdus pacifica TaxID=2305227 RepID=UPI001008BC78|nr:ribonuclease III domain-containing protein [Longirhabdus pacifica]